MTSFVLFLMLFISLSYIQIYELYNFPSFWRISFDISCQSSLTILCFWVRLIKSFTFTFEGQFHWIQNSKLMGFLFRFWIFPPLFKAAWLTVCLDINVFGLFILFDIFELPEFVVLFYINKFGNFQPSLSQLFLQFICSPDIPITFFLHLS